MSGTEQCRRGSSLVGEDVLTNMRGRAHQLRRIAEMTHDPRITELVLNMAREIEADIRRLERKAVD